MCYSRFFDGSLAVVACEGNKNLPSDSGQKVGLKATVSSINNSSTWNIC
jgi:hypothetical protein